MPVIIIAADSYTDGHEIGKQAAEVLGYSYVDREVLGDISRGCDIPEERLVKVLDQSLPLGGVFNKQWRRHLACIQQKVLQRLLEDNVVCHGLCAHLYVLGVSHVIRVRLLSQTDSSGIVDRPGVVDAAIIEEDAKRFQKLYRHWSLKTIDPDQTDLGRYDLVINLNGREASEAVRMMTDAVENPKFRANTCSINCLKDLELTARVRGKLLEKFANVTVETNAATVVVRTRLPRRSRHRQIETIKRLVGGMPGVSYVEVHAINGLLPKPTL